MSDQEINEDYKNLKQLQSVLKEHNMISDTIVLLN